MIFCFFPFIGSGQTNREPAVVSPEVYSDGRVTFRLGAPKAADVSLAGDWLPSPLPMQRESSGVWSITAGPLEPGISIYNFKLDGIDIADPVNPRMKLRARTSASLVEVGSKPSALWDARPVEHGSIQINWHSPKATGDTRAFYVYTPPEYRQNGSRRYPVLYLLHGNNDTAAGWTDVGKANFILDNLLAEKKAAPMIIVMPWGHAVPFSGGRNDNTAVFERYLLEELVPQVEKNYRALKGRDNRALVGLSMGGGQALKIGFSHLDQFSAIGAFSAAVPKEFGDEFKSVLSDSARLNARLQLLWIGCGEQDEMFNRSIELDTVLTGYGIDHTFLPMPGRHNYAVWRKCLVQVAPFLFRKHNH